MWLPLGYTEGKGIALALKDAHSSTEVVQAKCQIWISFLGMQMGPPKTLEMYCPVFLKTGRLRSKCL